MTSVSTPQPRASGAPPRTPPGSGSAARSAAGPAASRRPGGRPDNPTTRPCPPSSTVAAKTAMVMSAVPRPPEPPAARPGRPTRLGPRRGTAGAWAARGARAGRPGSPRRPGLQSAALPAFLGCRITTAPGAGWCPAVPGAIIDDHDQATRLARPRLSPSRRSDVLLIPRRMTTATSFTRPLLAWAILGDAPARLPILFTAGPWLWPAQVRVVDEGEHRVEAGDLKDLAHRGLGGGDL